MTGPWFAAGVVVLVAVIVIGGLIADLTEREVRPLEGPSEAREGTVERLGARSAVNPMPVVLEHLYERFRKSTGKVGNDAD